MTREIATAVQTAVDPAGVGVVVEASHMCMVKSKSGIGTVSCSLPAGEFAVLTAYLGHLGKGWIVRGTTSIAYWANGLL